MHEINVGENMVPKNQGSVAGKAQGKSGRKSKAVGVG
jgi:hypothetical protein